MKNELLKFFSPISRYAHSDETISDPLGSPNIFFKNRKLLVFIS